MGQPVTEATVEGEIPDARPAVIHQRRELARRFSDGLEVALYWSADDNSISVQVCQPASDEVLMFTVAGEHALDAFYHPFAHLPAGR